jgi:azurin
MIMPVQTLVRSSSVLALALLLGSCGDKPSEVAKESTPLQQEQPAAPTPPPAPPPAPAAVLAKPDPDGVVRLTGNDQMRFNANRIEVPAGQKIKIELKNIGVLPKEAMGHDLVVLRAGTDPMAFGAKAMTAKATDYIPPDALDQIVAHTKLLGPGESETIEFEVPGPGSYPFLCTFPGHVALMSGTLVVL